ARSRAAEAGKRLVGGALDSRAYGAGPSYRTPTSDRGTAPPDSRSARRPPGRSLLLAPREGRPRGPRLPGGRELIRRRGHAAGGGSRGEALPRDTRPHPGNGHLRADAVQGLVDVHPYRRGP